VYLSAGRADVQVPFREVHLRDSPAAQANPPVRLYDTSGPGSDPEVGLPALRARWIEAETGLSPAALYATTENV
jgi:phosphomethylpyrimidine synthase